jgi:hypothetical protein
MNKALVLVAMILLVSLSMQAQNAIYFGPRAGLSLGNASLTPDLPADVSKSMRTGFSAGAYGEFGVAEGLAGTVEGLYSQGGFKESAGGVDATFKWDYIGVPVNLKYMFTMQGSSVKPYVFGGGNLALTTKAEFETPAGTMDVKDSVESLGYGVQFGAGVQFEVSPGVNFMVDGQYNLGLKDMDKTSTGEVKPNGIMIMLGVAFKVN